MTSPLDSPEAASPMSASSPYGSAARSVRWVFFSMGIPIGTLVPRLAEIKTHLGADNAAYGTAIAIGGGGSMLGSWLGGRMAHVLGSRNVARLAIFLVVIASISNALAPSVEMLALVSFASGFAYSVTNVAMASQAVLTEQGLGRSFVPRAHAFWSLGTMSSSLVSSLAAPFISPRTALIFGGVVALVMFQLAARGLLGMEHEDRPADDPTQLPRHERIPGSAMRFLVVLAIAQTLGLIAEMSVGDWSSVLLHQNFTVAVGPNGYGFTSFMLVQLLTRLVATRLIDARGLQPTIRLLGIIGTVGYVVALATADVLSGRHGGGGVLVAACVAYAFLGIAVGSMPAAFTTAAGAIPGLPTARALMVTGIVVAVSAMIGRVTLANIAQIVPLPIALGTMGLLVLAAVSMTSVLQPQRAEQHAIRR